MIEVTGKLKEQWNKTIVGILAYFVGLCEQQGFRYYVAYGSALGALRHGGIIPWDDDIDVVMPRADYEQFLAYCEQHDTGKYKLYHTEISTDFYVSFMKLVDGTTNLRESVDQRMTIGLFIDIFPLDGCPAQEVAFTKALKKMKQTYLYMFREASLNKGLFNGFRMLTRGKVKFFVRSLLIASGRRHWRNWAIRKGRTLAKSISFDSAEYVVNYLGVYGSKERMPKAVYGPGRNVNFEGLLVRVPFLCEEYLTHLYGDWQKLPPPQQRRTHHLISFVSFTDEETL